MSNFANLLSKPASDIERPKPLPVGTYLGLVAGAPEFKDIGKNKTPAAEFKIKVLAAQQDVDLEALTAAGGLDNKIMTARFFLTDDSMYRLKEFLTNALGIEEGRRTIGELLSEAPNKQVYITVSHRPSEDGQQIYAEIKSYARI